MVIFTGCPGYRSRYEQYAGADLLPGLVASNNRRFGREGLEFPQLDITRDLLPGADLILCRHCLVHLPFADIHRAIKNLARSRATYLLVTTFTAARQNIDIPVGHWRPLNLQLPPFNFPVPDAVINEQCTENDGMDADKSLGLWRIAALPGSGGFFKRSYERLRRGPGRSNRRQQAGPG